MSTTTIEWTDRVWNPIRGCSMVSAGCEHCYAMKQAHRFAGPGKPFDGLTELGPRGPRWTGKIRLVSELLDEPLRLKRPQRIFVNSMSDLFHPDVPDDFLYEVFGVMALAEQHTFQVLTKRPERMLDFLNDWKSDAVAEGVAQRRYHEQTGEDPSEWLAVHFPLKNVWLGVSAEDQATADARISILRKTPAAIRFVSLEPLLSSVNLSGYGAKNYLRTLGQDGAASQPGLDWVIVGGESGPKARPCDVAWIRSIVNQCKAAGVPVFVKQVGARPLWSYDDLKYMPPQQNPHKQYRSFLRDRKGGDPFEWPADLQVQEMP